MPLVRALGPSSLIECKVADKILRYAMENDLIEPVGEKEAVRRIGKGNLWMICNYSGAFREGAVETQIQAAKLLRENFDLVRAVWPQLEPKLEALISQTLLRLD